MHFKDIPEGQYPVRNGWRIWRRAGWLTVQQFPGLTHVWWTEQRFSNSVADELTFVEVDDADRLLSYGVRQPMMDFRMIWNIEKGMHKNFNGDEADAQRAGIKMAMTMLRLLEPVVVASMLSGFRHHLSNNCRFP